MTLNQLEYFVEIANAGSYAKAAQLIHISQPSLSTAIHNLEKELDVQLFESRRKQIILTDAGRIFLEDARNLLKQKETAIFHMRQFTQKDQAQIRVAYTASFADQTMPDLIAQFLKSQAGNIQIYSTEMPSDQIAQALRDNQIDLGICSLIPADPLILRQTLTKQPFCLITPSDDPWTYENLHDFEQAVVLDYHQDYPMARNLAALYDHLQIHPNFHFFGYSEGAIAKLVERGTGIAVIAQIEGLEHYNVRILHPKWLEGFRSICLLTSTNRPLSPLTQAFADKVIDHFKQTENLASLSSIEKGCH